MGLRLVGFFIFYKLSEIKDKKDNALYKDDGFVFNKNGICRKMNKIRKKLFRLFKHFRFNITIDTDLKTVNIS